jgi:hypothetical protein
MQDTINKYGDFNAEGLKQLEEKYEVYKIDNAIDSMRDAICRLENLIDDAEKLRSVASELIDGYSGCGVNKFNVDENGDLGVFVIDVCDAIDNCTHDLESASKLLASLQRLLPTEDGSVYIDIDDKLDNEELEDDEWL